MRVIQCYSSRFLGYYEPFRLDSLIASAIQWKSVFPEDYLVLTATSDVKHYAEVRLKGKKLPWDEIQVCEGYPMHDTEFYYDYTRFSVSAQQTEPFIFLDPDVFVFKELLNNRKFREARENVLKGKEYYCTYIQSFRIPDEWIEEAKSYPESVHEAVKDLDIDPIMTNTGFFIATPKVAKKMSEKAMEVQTCFARDWGEHRYCTSIHEYASSVVTLAVLKAEGVPVNVFESDYLLHTCSCLLPPNHISKICPEYFGTIFNPSEEIFARRLTVYREVWKKIVESGYISYSDFEKSFIRDWQDSKKVVKKGPILI